MTVCLIHGTANPSTGIIATSATTAGMEGMMLVTNPVRKAFSIVSFLMPNFKPCLKEYRKNNIACKATSNVMMTADMMNKEPFAIFK
jgi:hypothetical protein